MIVLVMAFPVSNMMAPPSSPHIVAKLDNLRSASSLMYDMMQQRLKLQEYERREAELKAMEEKKLFLQQFNLFFN